MAYLLQPPVVKDLPFGGGRLFSRFKTYSGISLLVTGSTVTEVRTPTDDQVRAADRAYLGGRDHYISDAEAAVLQAAGYGDLLSPWDGYLDVYEESYTVGEDTYSERYSEGY